MHQALVAAKAIKEQDSKSWALADIADAYAKSGDFTQVFKIIESLPNEHDKSWTLAGVAAEIVKLSEDDRSTLVEFTHAIRPWSQFWKSIDQQD